MTKLTKSGQALLIVIFALSLGLVVLVGVSQRVVTTIRRTFVSNSYFKAQSAAEAGAELFLTKDTTELASLAATCQPAALYTQEGFASPLPSDCVLTLAEAKAVIGVESYPDTVAYDFTIGANSAMNVNLEGLTDSELQVCWQGVGASGGQAFASVSAVYYYKDGSDYKAARALYECDQPLNTWCTKPVVYHSAGATEVPASVGGRPCFDLSLDGEPRSVSLTTLANGSAFSIISTSALPRQGFKITSVGEVTAPDSSSLTGSISARKKVVVEKNLAPQLGPWFNFAAVSKTGSISADN